MCGMEDCSTIHMFESWYAKSTKTIPNINEDTWWTTFKGTEDGMTRILKLPSRRNGTSLVIAPMFGLCDVSNNPIISGKYLSHSIESGREQSIYWTRLIFKEAGGGGGSTQVLVTIVDDWSTHRVSDQIYP